jgi:hypothetical protein
MGRNHLNALLGFGLLLSVVLACKFSATTANISGLKIGKDENVSSETSTFGPKDTIYAVANVSNVPGKVKLKGRLAIEDVPGQRSGPVPGLEDTVELSNSGTATFTFTPASAGWPKGKYKLEVLLLTETGEQKDEKSTTFTVS